MIPQCEPRCYPAHLPVARPCVGGDLPTEAWSDFLLAASLAHTVQSGHTPSCEMYRRAEPPPIRDLPRLYHHGNDQYSFARYVWLRG